MLENDYISNTDVHAFSIWLSSALNDRSLTHHYRMPGDKHMSFSGLIDALDQYNWSFKVQIPGMKHERKGMDYAANADVLNVLSNGLKTSINLPRGHKKNRTICEWSIAVMEWGGVTNGNVKWLNNNVNNLSSEITNTRKILRGNNDDQAILNPVITRFNAGMTKVYSLLLDNFIIYDSRVAAALAWLVVRWCKESSLSAVPKLLRFRCMPPHEGNNPAIRKIRNPSDAMYSFLWMNNNPVNHAHWNLRASWILAETLKSSKDTEFHRQGNPLRALEAALFMWGYDLGQNIPSKTVTKGVADNTPDNPQKTVQSDTDLDPIEDDWQQSFTRGGGNANAFRWRFDCESDALVIDRILKNHDYFTLGELFSVIQTLHGQLACDWYPLANNVVRMADGTERMGLGSSIYAESNDTTHAQAASQLGVILEETGVFEWNGRSRNIAWRLRDTPPLTVEDLRSYFEPGSTINPEVI